MTVAGTPLAAAVAAALLWASPAFAAALEPVDLELVFAADGSGSIDDDELALQRRGYAAAVTHPKVLAAIRGNYRQAIAVAYMEWGGPDSQHTIVDWMKVSDEASAQAFAQRLVAEPRRAEGYNSISEAIAYSTELIRANAYEGARKIIDVSGDGPQIGGRPLSAARVEALLAGITINALVVAGPSGHLTGPRGEHLVDHYRNDVIGGRGAFVHVAVAREHFAEAILKKLIFEVASDGGEIGAR